MLDKQGQEKPSDRPPRLYPALLLLSPSIPTGFSLPCGVPAGHQAALEPDPVSRGHPDPDPVSHGHPAPCSGAPRCTTPPPLRSLWLTAPEAQLLGLARGPCPERRASRRVLQRRGPLLARQRGSVMGTLGWAPRGSGQSLGLSLPCPLPSPQRASVCGSCWPALPKGSQIPPLPTAAPAGRATALAGLAGHSSVSLPLHSNLSTWERGRVARLPTPSCCI